MVQHKMEKRKVNLMQFDQIGEKQLDSFSLQVPQKPLKFIETKARWYAYVELIGLKRGRMGGKEGNTHMQI